MKTVTLLHNPKAGDKEYSKDELVGYIESSGYKCHYFDVKKSGWDKINPDTDILAVAGGDGTIRKVISKLTKNKNLYAIAPIPLGTANNISKSLNITGSPEEIVASWKTGKIINYDVGEVTGMEKSELFIESFGTGVFPELIHSMEKVKKSGSQTPEEEMDTALKTMLGIINSFTPVRCTIEIDGADYSGNYLLAEIMNIRSIGPNLDLNPGANPSDGIFETVLVEESERKGLAAFIESKLKTGNAAYNFKTIKGRHIKIGWDKAYTHIDDELAETKRRTEAELKVHPGLVQLILPR
jgi:diacylglycerol kinase family enzyme